MPNAIEILCQHIKAMVDGGFISIEEMAAYLGTSPHTVRELIDGKLKPSRELVAEIEALSESFKADPSGEFARKLVTQRRVKAKGAVKVYDFASRKRR